MRWKALIPTLILAALGAVFTFFFLGTAVEWAVEKTGTKANGAKVELDGVDVSLRKLSLTLKHLQVADEENPMTNAVEVDSIRLKLAPKPLAWKKLIVEDAAITNIMTGTPRKTSGAVPKQEKETAEEEAAKSEEPSAAAEKAKEAASFAMANLKEQYDPEKLIQLENLASYKKIMEEKDRFAQTSQAWETRVNSLDVEGKTREAKDFVARMKSEKFQGIEGVKKAKDAVEQAKAIQGNIQQARKDFDAVKDAVKAEIAQAKDGLKQIDALRQQDTDAALGQLKAGFSAEGITQGLVGPQWFAKIRSALGWFYKIRGLIPKKKPEAVEPPPPPREGKDIAFPFRYNWPSFHLKQAAVSGITSGEDAIGYEGVLRDVTSSPSVVGLPIALDIKGRKRDAPGEITMHAELDYTTDVPREQVKLAYRGIRLDGTELGNVGGGAVGIQRGEGALTLDLEAKADQIAGRAAFMAAPVQLAHQLTPEQAANRLNVLLHDVLAKLDKLDMTILISDRLLSPNFKLQTTLDEQINAAVKQVLQKELEELRARFKARVDELVNGEKQKLADQLNGKASSVTGLLNDKDGAIKSAQEQVQKTIDDLKKQATEALPVPANLPVPLPGASQDDKPSLPSIKNPFKKK